MRTIAYRRAAVVGLAAVAPGHGTAVWCLAVPGRRNHRQRTTRLARTRISPRARSGRPGITHATDLLVSTFEDGKIEYNPKTDQVEVTVNSKVVPRGP